MAEKIYNALWNDICMLCPFTRQETKDKIITKHKLLFQEFTLKDSVEKTEIIEYFQKCAADYKYIYENDKYHWTAYFGGRRYEEYLLIIEILQNEVN